MAPLDIRSPKCLPPPVPAPSTLSMGGWGLGILPALRGAREELLGQTLFHCQLSMGHSRLLSDVEARHPGQLAPGQFPIQAPGFLGHCGCLAGILKGPGAERRGEDWNWKRENSVHSRLFSWIHQVLTDNGSLFFPTGCLKCTTRAL